MRILLSVLSIMFLLFLSGCESEPEVAKPAETAQTKPHQVVKEQPLSQSAVTPTGDVVLLDAPVEPHVFELPSFALSAWQDVPAEKPALVLFSIHPLLEPVKSELRADVNDLVTSGSPEEIIQRGSFYRANPAVLPTQAVSAALLADLFSEIIWVFPSTAAPEQMDLALFSKQVREAGFLTEEESAQLNLNNGTYSGTVSGVPFRAVHPEVLPEIDKPFVLHVDLGYFKNIYINEVKTPIYNTILDTLLAMAEVEWAPLLVTTSYSTVEGTISHDVRFLMTAFNEILRNPDLLNKMPESWRMRQEAMYSKEFFLDTKSRELVVENAGKHPVNAAAQYDLYLQKFNAREIDEALAQLDKAVALDPGYGAAYLELAQIARKDGNLPATLELLEKGDPLFPHNPFIDLYMAQYLIELGQPEQARPIIERLQTLRWSKHYHKDIPELLDNMLQATQEAPQ